MGRTAIAATVSALLVASGMSALLALAPASSAATTATARAAVKTQLLPRASITGVSPILWIPAGTRLTAQCLAVGQKAYGAVAKADPYYYRVTYKRKTGYAIDADLYTPKRATALGLTYCSIPAEPTHPRAGSKTSSSVVLSWSDKSNNETSFRTQYSTNGGRKWKPGPSAGRNRTSIKITGLSASRKYTFQVGASNNKGTKWSAYVTATTTRKPTTRNVGSGSCDYVKKGGNYVRSVGKGTVLHTYTVNGWKVAVCGPRPNFGGGLVGSGRGVNPFGHNPNSSDLDGYQCTELTARWLYYVHGVKITNAAGSYLGGNGRDVVNNYAAKFSRTFVKYSNAKTHKPAAGDVISFDTGTPAGHVGLVYKVNIASSGTGTVEVLEQNSGRPGGSSGKSTYRVSNWKIEQAINWLHRR